MSSEFKLSPLAPTRAREVGQPRFLRWAFLTAAMGALSSNMNVVLTTLGVPPVPLGVFEPALQDQVFFLYFLANVAPPCIFVGGGLALAATVELRQTARSSPEVPSGAVLSVWTTWTLLFLAVLGIVSPAGTP
ncbi:MAG TPA: hypothetical protein VLN73_04720 [Alphaproteobacteria bacterium]|nr:hypothetical protein [Alphaproteobacteria bacterium]